MRVLVFLCFMVVSLPVFSQSEQDSTLVTPPETIDSPSDNLKDEFKELLREWADSIQRTSGTEEALSQIEALQEKFDTSVSAMKEAYEDQAESEDAAGAGATVVNQFQESFQKIWEGLSSTLTLGNLVAMAFILLFGLFINVLLKGWVGNKETTPHRTRLRRLRWYPLLRFINWALVIILFAALLLQHPDVLWPALTAMAIGLGLAIKDGLSDLLGGLWLIFERPYQIGDRIQAGGHYGEVTRIGIRSTQITTLDDNLVTIPNSTILGDPVANSNAGETDCMAVVRIWLPLNTDLEMARTTAHEAAITSRYFNFDKGVKILFQDHIGEPPGTILQIKAYVLDAKFEKAFEGDVTETVKRTFVKAGVY